MEEYLAQTQAILGLFQSQLSEEEMEKMLTAANDMYEVIQKQSEKHQLNVIQMFAATLALTASVTEICLDYVEQQGDSDEKE